jgi:hypothetical protein
VRKGVVRGIADDEPSGILAPHASTERYSKHKPDCRPTPPWVAGASVGLPNDDSNRRHDGISECALRADRTIPPAWLGMARKGRLRPFAESPMNNRNGRKRYTVPASRVTSALRPRRCFHPELHQILWPQHNSDSASFAHSVASIAARCLALSLSCPAKKPAKRGRPECRSGAEIQSLPSATMRPPDSRGADYRARGSYREAGIRL